MYTICLLFTDLPLLFVFTEEIVRENIKLSYLFAPNVQDFESVRNNSYLFVLIDNPNRITFGDLRTRDENTRVFGVRSRVRCGSL